MDNADYDYLFKLLLVGNYGTGKTSLIIKYVDGTFEPKDMATIGVDFKMRTLDCNGKRVKLQIWDTAGQERFKTITASYFRGAHGIFVAYDITKNESFNEVKSHWYEEAARLGSSEVSIVLLGNKSDLEGRRAVNYNLAKQFADEKKIPFLETSSLDSSNVTEAFSTMVQQILEKYHKPAPNNIISPDKPRKQSSGGCC
jgi:Ras-related protein Rab-1A